MNRTISKRATIRDQLRRKMEPHASAREAFRSYLDTLEFTGSNAVLLPAFIGWSPREGSGVFDPVSALGLTAVFYPLDDRLRIDLDLLEQIFRTHSIKLFVIIHYFGYVDPSAAHAISLARHFGADVLEDEAHAMLTDLVAGGSGRAGNASLFSLHKLLPCTSGGVLVRNELQENQRGRLEPPEPLWDLLNYDLWRISSRRRENARYIHQLILPLEEWVEPLWGLPSDNEIPQTYPVLIKTGARDDLYFDMNDRGFGVTSLYHTMIPEITAAEFPKAHEIAKHIMNLPIHQDVQQCNLEAMIDAMRALLDGS